jgi:hypothetical protein
MPRFTRAKGDYLYTQGGSGVYIVRSLSGAVNIEGGSSQQTRSNAPVPSRVEPLAAGKACLSEAEPRLAAAELFRVDVFRDQVIAVGKSRRAEGIDKQLTHVPRWQG